MILSASTIPAYAAVACVALLVYEQLRQLYFTWYSQRQAPNCQAPRRRNQSRFLFGLDWLYQVFLPSIQKRQVLALLRNEHATYGDTYCSFLLGKTVIHSCEARNLQAVFSTQFNDFELGHARRAAFRPLLGDGIFTTDGQRWQHARRLLKPNLTKEQLSAFLPRFEGHVQTLIGKMKDRYDPNLGVDVQPLLYDMTTDAITNFLLGVSSQGQSWFDELNDNVNIASEGIIKRTRLGPLRDYLIGRRFFQACAQIRSVISDYVDVTIKEEKNRNATSKATAPYTLLRGMLDLGIQDRKELCDHALNFLGAGRDTTAATVSVSLFMLARNPVIWKQLVDEVAFLEGKPPSFQQLRELQLMSQFLKEILRLYPPAPLTSRSALRDTTLPTGGGPDGTSPIFVPKGTSISISFHVLHRNKEAYALDPEAFRPQRWADPEFRPGWAFSPFGGGPRNCIGRKLFYSH